MSASALRAALPRQRLLIPEVVQSSAMDCGPAALKALLAGFDIAVSYSRLREACQTTVDGTSIDTLEELACGFGLRAEQVMLPTDFVALPETEALPALIVTQLPGGATHFVVLWSRVLDWVQVMDPAVGRRWIPLRRLSAELYLHQQAVPLAAWQEWSASDGFRSPLQRLMRDIGVTEILAAALFAACDPEDWLAPARLDAAVRMTGALIRCGAVGPGAEAARTIAQLVSEDAAARDENDVRIPARYWTVLPAEDADAADEPQVLLRGAVLVRVETGPPAPADEAEDVADEAAPPELAPEAAAALQTAPDETWSVLWKLLRQDGAAVLVLAAVALLAAGVGLLLQSLLLQGLLAMATLLPTTAQRLTATAAVFALLAALMLLQTPLTGVLQRIGQRLEARLRVTLLTKIARLSDRYFHSRLTSDMAQRAHSLRLLRRLPDIVGVLLTTLFQLLLTTAAIGLLFPQSFAFAVLATLWFVVSAVVAAALLNEGDLRLRAHSAGLSRFVLDALRGLVPLRTHSAERAFRREHERLLAEWIRAALTLTRLDVGLQLLQSLTYTAFAIWLLNHYLSSGGQLSSALLLLYWTLNLPQIGQSLVQQLQQLPTLRNTLQRVIEPLGAAEEAAVDQPASMTHKAAGVAVQMQSLTVQAAGQTILTDVNLELAAGEQLAIVGPSGAGKSTLVGLLLGWHRPAAGTLQVDGRPLQDEQLAALRGVTAWLDPAVQIWNRSLFENLVYGTPPADGVQRALRLADADLLPLVERLEHGLQTVLGEGGGLVSGGEGQRVRFARALQRSAARLVILDEPFRGLDRAQRRALLQRARSFWPAATLLCVTHDVGETLDFPRVLVVEGGRIVEDGAPAALAATATRYAELLAAERALRDGMWATDPWRRLRLSDGVLTEMPPPSGS